MTQSWQRTRNVICATEILNFRNCIVVDDSEKRASYRTSDVKRIFIKMYPKNYKCIKEKTDFKNLTF